MESMITSQKNTSPLKPDLEDQLLMDCHLNGARPHQGINSIPDDPTISNNTGSIQNKPVLFGLYHHYFVDAA